jgi:hypothetical protein
MRSRGSGAFLEKHTGAASSAMSSRSAGARSIASPLTGNGLHNHGNSLRDHASGEFLQKHGSGTLHDQASADFSRTRSNGTLRNLGTARDWHGGGDWRGGHDWHHFNQHRFHDSFFFGLGYPFGGYGFYDPWWPAYGFGYYGPMNSSYYSAWPYYEYDPYCNYSASVGYAAPGYAALSGSFALSEPGVAAADGVATSTPTVAKSFEPVTATPGPNEFAGEGEAAFKGRDYEAAVRAWRHAVLDEPKQGTLVLMLAQALFAAGEYDEAAGATQQAMTLLPEDKWGVLVGNYTDLYSDTQDYVDQLKALEKVVKEKPKDPALRFLVGFHYGYLGYPIEATRELDELLKLASQDKLGRKLRDLMGEKAKQKSPSPATSQDVKP